MKKLLYGVAINDADYDVNPTVNGTRKTCKLYEAWYNMLRRCYSKKVQEKHPTYIGCTVCDEWLVFSNFKKWMITQDWQGKELDKDLLVSGNKIYCPERCIFVPAEINALLTSAGARRGLYPIGVHFCKREVRFVSQVKAKGKTKFLGYFSDQYKAHKAWQYAKERIIRGSASEDIDEQLVNALNRIADKVQQDMDSGIETTHY